MKCDQCGCPLGLADHKVLSPDWRWLCGECVPPIHPAHAQNAGVALRVLGLLLLLVLIGGLLWLKGLAT